MPPEPLFLGANIYRGSSYGAWHPLRIPRVPTVIDLAASLGWLPPARFRTSPRARPAALAAFHTQDYIAALIAAEAAQAVTPDIRARHHLGTPSNPVFPEMFRRPATGAGGSILAGELLRDPGVIFHPGGGTHHGMPDRANGFCYLNDPVLAILSLRARGLRRIAYVDIDAHHPDGVEAAFADDPDVALVSVHEENRWPRTGLLGDRGAGNAWNLPLPRGAGDGDMAAARDLLILPVVGNFRPEALILQCGADALAEDPQSGLAMTNAAHLAVVAALRPLAPRFLVLGGGGYNPWSVGRLWTAVWGLLAGQDLPDALPPAAAQVLAALDWGGAMGRRLPQAQWTTTLLDRPDPRGPLDETRARLSVLTSRQRQWT